MLIALLVALQLTLSLHHGFAPLTVPMKLTIEPNYLNYLVCVEWDGPESGRSCWSLDGQYAARTHLYEIKALPTGQYAVRAQLFRVRETITTPIQPIQVLERLP